MTNDNEMFGALQGLPQAELDEVRAALAAGREREDRIFVLRYFSQSRRCLLIISHEDGRLTDWLLMHCPTAAAVPELLRWWTETATEQAQDREAASQAAVAQVVDRARDQRH